MRGFNLSAWAVRNDALVLFGLIAIAAGGIFAWQKLGRAEDPSFTIKMAIVTTAWPGATAQDMQDQVSDPIEKKLQELPYFDKVVTYTKPGFNAMQVAFKDSTPPRMVPELFYQLRKKLGDLKPSLPAGIIGPNVNDEYGDVDSILYAVSSKDADYAGLKKVAEGMRQRLLSVSGVAKVNLYGAQDERIYVEISHARLGALGIAPQAIFQSLAKQNAVAAAGVFETGAQRIPLRVSGTLRDVAAVRETPVEANGTVFRLGDIAKVTHGFEDPASYLIEQRGVPALLVGVVMTNGENILDLGRALETTMAQIRSLTPVGIDIEQIADQPKIVTHAISEFTRSFIEALAIVLAVSFLSLGWRTGIVVALSVPLVLAMTLLAMQVMGMDLHRITLGALIIALGLLVDDAIIAVEMMVVKMEQGWTRMKAATFAWESTAFPMLTGTLVTAAGFLPVGFSASSTSEYTGGIFWVVGIALLASWLVAVVFTPWLGVKLLPDFASKTGHHDEHAIYETRLYRALRRAVVFCVRRRGLVILTTLGIFAAAIVGFGHVQQQFFPISERTELFFQMRLPEGSGIGPTTQTAHRAEAMIAQDPDVATYTTYIGQGSPRFWLGLNPQLPNEAFAEIVVVAKDIAGRERLKTRLDHEIADGALSAARVRVDRFNFGPPVGFPVQFRVVGPDPNEVRRIAYQVRDIVRSEPRAIDPHLDWNERTPSVKLEVDQDRARALGLTPQDIADSLQMLVSGVPVTTIRDGTEKVTVVARAPANERGDLGSLSEITVLARNGVAVPLGQVAKIAYQHEEPILWRRNRDMSITVRADVVDGVQPPDVTNAVWPKFADIRAKLAPGYRLEIGGAIEESEKANAALFSVFPAMIMVMLSFLMIQLRSFARLALVLLTAPLGIIGASLSLNLAGMPFGFVALLGLIALAGMIMRNTVILVDQIESDVRSGRLTRGEAIIEATVRRARPVILTALAAILAMIPLSRSAFWGPMAVTIMGGLFVATFLTLLFLPALYALWFRRSLTFRAQDPNVKTPAPQTSLPLAAE
jgi:multidrug efflux pump